MVNEEYMNEKENVGYTDESEKRDGSLYSGENSEEQAMSDGKDQRDQMIENGSIEQAKTLCSMDMTDTISNINQYIYKIKQGYLLNLDGHYQYIIDTLRNSYIDHLEKNTTRFDELLENEENYFTQKFNTDMYNEILNDRQIYINETDNQNDDKIYQNYVKNIKKLIYVNDQFTNQEYIIYKQKKELTSQKNDIIDNIDVIDNYNDVEGSKFNNKNIEFIKHVGFYIYFAYILYFCVFISFLLITDLKNTITSFSRIALLIFLFTLPDYIYPYIYFNILVPLFDYIMDNNVLTKELPPNVYQDIEDKAYLNK